MPDVLLATCAELPDGDEDAQLLDDALARAGLTARWASWTDEQVRWDDSLVVLRSTWDYTFRRPAFLDWIGGLDRVANSARTVRWNTDKTYLRDLAAAGVPTVPSFFAEPGEAVQFPESPEFVVKPSVGAGSRGAGRFTHDRLDDARTHAEGLHAAGRTVLVQPYLELVEEWGETALIYFDGVFSHAITKGAMLPAGFAHPVVGGSLFVPENISPRVPDPAELAVGAAAVAAVRERAGDDELYTRVDLLPGPAGPLVTELELTEPSLFLSYAAAATGAADRFAAAIGERA